VQVKAEDHTAEFVSILRSELARIADDAAHAEIRQSWRTDRARRPGRAGLDLVRGAKRLTPPSALD